MLPCCYIYGMMTNEFVKIDIITVLQNARLGIYLGNTTLIILNLIVLVCFLLNFIVSHNLSFNFGKAGERSKVKQLAVILGAPLFITLFMIAFLNV